MQQLDSLLSETNPITTAAKPKTSLPVVPYVRVLSYDGSFDCPYDRYFLSRKMAKLEYSKDNKGGNVISLPALLRTCPECRRMFIDKNQVLGLKKAGLDIRGFDIIGSVDFPRMKEYEAWHPEAIAKPVDPAALLAAAAAAKPVKKKAAPRKPSAKKLAEAAAAAAEAAAEAAAAEAAAAEAAEATVEVAEAANTADVTVETAVTDNFVFPAARE